MSMRGNMAGILALSALFEGESFPFVGEKRLNVEPDTEGQIARRQKAHIEVLMSKGLKWFDINGVHILALNKKNAERKAKKLGV